MTTSTPRRFPVMTSIAEHSLLVEFGDDISAETNGRVRGLDQALTRSPCPGQIELVPAYASLLLRFDPLIADHRQAEAHVAALLGEKAVPAPEPQIHRIGVCYDDDLAPDLDAVAQMTGLSPEVVIAAHLAGEYQVFMYGFAPGYAYLAGVPEAIRLPRKPAARRDIPAGSILIAGQQCLISTLRMPTGWWIIGQSAARVLTGDPARPFLFDPGDRLSFYRVSRAALEAERNHG